MKSSFLDSRQIEEEKKDEGLDALIKTKEPVQSVGAKWYPTADLKGD
jgi:hypothetical protein